MGFACSWFVGMPAFTSGREKLGSAYGQLGIQLWVFNLVLHIAAPFRKTWDSWDHLECHNPSADWCFLVRVNSWSPWTLTGHHDKIVPVQELKQRNILVWCVSNMFSTIFGMIPNYFHIFWRGWNHDKPCSRYFMPFPKGWSVMTAIVLSSSLSLIATKVSGNLM